MLLFPPVQRRLKRYARRILRDEQTTAGILPGLAAKHGDTLSAFCASQDLNAPPAHLLLLGLKQEQLLEVYGRDKKDAPWRPLVSYPFTATSGTLGPKLREGDRQIPEGFYGIGYLNPNSSYHLSMQIDYPNAADHAQAKRDGRSNPGSAIMIHGSNVTIGCIPIGDDAIEQLYLLVAQTGQENTQVWIAPHDFRTHPQPPKGDWPAWVLERYQKLREALSTLPSTS